MTSKVPESSPEATREQKSSSKCKGCLASAPARPVPEDTSARTSKISSRIFSWSVPSATMSNACTKGTPAFIIVASCRVNIAISAGLIFFAPKVISGLGFFFTDLVKMPCLRSCTRAKAAEDANTSPVDERPFRSVPLHTKTMLSAAISSLT